MGRPDQSPSPRMNNHNPMYNEHPEAPFHEPVQTGPYQNNVPMGNQQYGAPVGRPVQAPYYHNGAMGNQQNGVAMSRPVNNQVQPSNWSSGLFDCFDDSENALITCCFPFITFGQIAEVVDQGATSCGTGGIIYGTICCCLAIPCVYSCMFRTKIRNRYGLPDAPAPDWITHCFCEYCALCQEYRELNHRGLDPSIGWIGNLQKQQMGQQQMMAPPNGQRMMG